MILKCLKCAFCTGPPPPCAAGRSAAAPVERSAGGHSHKKRRKLKGGGKLPPGEMRRLKKEKKAAKRAARAAASGWDVAETLSALQEFVARPGDMMVVSTAGKHGTVRRLQFCVLARVALGRESCLIARCLLSVRIQVALTPLCTPSC